MKLYTKEQDGSSTLVMTFPLFKFLAKKWATALLEKGSVRLSSIAEFRKVGKYPHQIHDAEEGMLTISNFYTFYQGLPKNAIGALMYFQPPNANLNLRNYTHTVNFDHDNCLIYCSTTSLFNESMIQAFEDDKDACVLIKDPEKFFEIIAKNVPDAKYAGFRQCNYCGKKIYEPNPTSTSISHFICTHPHEVVLTKPANFINQDETRAVWFPIQNERLNSICLDISELKELVLNLEIVDVDTDLLKSKTNRQIGIELVRKEKRSIDISVRYPTIIPNPTIFHFKAHPERPLLGFLYDKEVSKNTFDDVYVSEAYYLKWETPYGLALFLNFLDEIESIRFYTVDNVKNILSKHRIIYIGELEVNHGGKIILTDVTCLNNLQFVRFCTKVQQEKNEDNFLEVRKANVRGKLTWVCTPKSKIQDNTLAIAFGKAIDEFYMGVPSAINEIERESMNTTDSIVPLRRSLISNAESQPTLPKADQASNIFFGQDNIPTPIKVLRGTLNLNFNVTNIYQECLEFNFGTRMTVPIDRIMNGSLFRDLFHGLRGEPVKIDVRDGKISLSFQIYDSNDKLVAFIKNNEWYIIEKFSGKYNYDERGFEIVDELGQVLLSIDIIKDKILFIQGVFRMLVADTIFIISANTLKQLPYDRHNKIDPRDTKNEASNQLTIEDYIKKINPLFVYANDALGVRT